MKTKIFVVIGLMTALTAGSFSANAADLPFVVATFSVIGDMVANVGGDHIALVTIVGPGGDCELYKPTLADGKAVAAARIVFMNELNDEFEPWIETLPRIGAPVSASSIATSPPKQYPTMAIFDASTIGLLRKISSPAVARARISGRSPL